MQDNQIDMKATHYRPACQTTVCGAAGRVVERIERGEILDQYAILRVKSSTDVRRVTCPLCRKWLREVTDQF